MDEHNPYQAPADVVSASSPDGTVHHRAGALAYAAWIFIFAINMAVPLLFSLALTDQHGRLGMSVAALFLLTIGCVICAANRKLAVALLAGGALVALSQLLPGLQIIAGMVGMGAGQALGHATFDSDDHPARITSEFGGFVVTFITGGILMAGSLCTGILLQFVTRFFGRAQR